MTANGLRNSRFPASQGPWPLSPWCPGKVWGEGWEDGDLSHFVVHGLWISSGQGLLWVSNVLKIHPLQKAGKGRLPKYVVSPTQDRISACARRSGH